MLNPRDPQLANDVSTLAQLTVAICLSPWVEEPSDPQAQDEAEELLGLAREVKDNLDVFLGEDVRADVVQLIEFIDRNRDQYRQSFLRWVDLLEEIAFYAEEQYGDDAGPLKSREVRAAVYYLLEGFFGPQAMPNVPPWMRPIVLEVIVRVTVEFLVTLDHAPDESMQLWREAPPAGRVGPVTKKVRVQWAKYRETVGERFVGMMVRILMPRPRLLPGRLKQSLDVILQRWAERNRITGSIPVQRAMQPVVSFARWIGDHGDHARAAVDAVTAAVRATARVTRLDRERQIEVVKEAVVMMFEDLGYRGPMFRTVVRFGVDLMAEATDNLLRKRGVI